MTAPLALTHRKITCVGVTPRRWAAFSTGTSTGPPGNFVIDLNIRLRLMLIKIMKYERETSISLSDDTVCSMVVQKRWMCGVTIGVQIYLTRHSVHIYERAALAMCPARLKAGKWLLAKPDRLACCSEERIPDWQLAWYEQFWVAFEGLQ